MADLGFEMNQDPEKKARPEPDIGKTSEYASKYHVLLVPESKRY